MSETATKSRPILFSGPMVRAILDGRKTQTRRVGAIQNPDWTELGTHYSTHATKGDEIVADYRAYPGQGSARHSICACPYGQAGDELFVRETFRFPASLDKYSPAAIGEQALDANYRKPWSPTKYEADGAVRLAAALEDFGDGTWGKTRVSIHMPRWASRITLTITNVRVERLREISEEDAQAEGVEPTVRLYGDMGGYVHEGHKDAFINLWGSINGAGSWQANPWVWVVEFQRKAGE